MQLKRIQIKRIEKLEERGRVFDLSVENNHNFFIGTTQTLTHNCDYLTPNAQAGIAKHYGNVQAKLQGLL